MRTKISEIRHVELSNILQRLRKGAVKELEELGIPFEYFTCDKCRERDDCDLVYDLYNIDGDCLWNK